ncbi:MAG: phosphoribosylformylglycinamidine synthase subunit PurL [Nitrospirae bacterium]|nr:phosphoribosylformylglycinamidine synthase subunit PurL [Nitrospirota bacterium]
MKEPIVTREMVAQHGLTEEEYAGILRILGREPTFTELGIFSVMWSEHCSYKSSRVHLRRFPTQGPRVLQGPGENAGIVDIGGGLAVAFKMESHNHPSFVEPYQGAATGVGGILRDIFTMGARPIASLNSLRFGPLDDPKHRYLLGGVVAGIAGYGNCIGVPTVGGEIQCDPSHRGNILVNVMTAGIVRADRIFRGKAAGVGNPVIYIGSRTGRDGIHGASLLASAEFDEASQGKRPTVQVGDPFTEKLLLEACLELMEGDCLVGIQDMGAAGLTSSSCEMASRAGTGIELDLDQVPRRETGMTPYEVMLSESQERMLLVAKAGKEEEVLRICRKWDLEAAIVGRVMEDGLIRVKDRGKVVAEIPAKALAEEAPRYDRPMRRPPWQDEAQALDLSQVPEPEDYGKTLLRLLATPGIADKEWVFRQYDHMVQTNTVVLPGSDAAVVRIKGTAKGVVLSADCNSRFCYLDPFAGAAHAVLEAARNVVCAGGKPLALTDCLNFGNPERPEIMWQFSQAVDGIAHACRALDLPVVSGNVSFYNETLGEAIHPTPTIGVVGLLEEVTKRLTQWFKAWGDLVVLLGETREELGGTEYLWSIHNLLKGKPPALDAARDLALFALLLEAAQNGWLHSAHDCSEGGLAVTLAECCISGPGRRLGAELAVPNPKGMRRDALLFGESAPRVVVSLAKAQLSLLEASASRHGVPIAVLGAVEGETLRLTVQDREVLHLGLADLDTAWRGSLASLMGG